jgi:crotonobetainyl-CoA:carnitine CoA-transferase CaiB-like acyl-CoA transferase
LHDDPEMIKRKWVVSYPQYYVGKLNQTGLLIDFSDTPGRIQGPPLVVGEQTEAIMTELGYSAADIEALVRDRVIAVWSAETADRSTPQNPWAKKAG